MKLFVYGELCKPAVLLQVLGRVPAAEPAIAVGYRRELNEKTGYYRAMRRNGALMPGLLLDEIAAQDLVGIDRYENVEGGEYVRLEVAARVVGSTAQVDAQLYAGVER